MTAPRERVAPRRCGERPWDLWAAEIGGSQPPRDRRRPTPLSGARLRRSEMALYGRAPAVDRLAAAVCHLCGDVVKCCAVRRHLRDRHGSKDAKEPDRRPEALPAPAQPSLPPPPAPAPPAHPAPPAPAVAAAPVAPPVPKEEPPVVSIEDDGSLAADDIIEIMNSEGIRSADDADGWPPAAVAPVPPAAPPPKETPPAPRLPPPTAPAPSRNRRRSKSKRPAAATAPSAAPPFPPPPRPKHAVREYDPNRHCGVAVGDNPKPCTRSLTCKSHALSLRRTVEGRAKPFDALLAEHRAARLTRPADEERPASPSPPPPPPVAPAPPPAPVAVAVAEPPAPERRPRTPEPAPADAPRPFEYRPSEVHWYPSRPRPLATCSFSARRFGGSLSLSGRLAAVRSGFRAATRPRAETERPPARPRANGEGAAPETRRLFAAFPRTAEGPKPNGPPAGIDLAFLPDALMADEKC